jgi:hypothetical protein
MKLIKCLGVLVGGAVLASLALASTAVATTLEIAGVSQTTDVTFKGSLENSSILTDTANTFANTCIASDITAVDSTATTGAAVSGPIESLTASNCTHGPVVVDKLGTFSIERIGSITNGTVRMSGSQWTVPATVGGSTVIVNCTTSNTDIGTLTGTKSGTATLDVNAVLNCGFFLPSAKWVGSYIVTSPAGLGVTS